MASQYAFKEGVDPPEQKVRTDIQAVMTVIGRRTRYWQQGEDDRLNLRETDLAKINLSGAHLEGADLTQAHLEGAFLTEAHLEGMFLTQAHLEGAFLGWANLSRAYLSEADLNGADLSEADLSGADLTGADLTDVRGLTAEKLDSATYDDTTKLPQHLIKQSEGEKKK